jgi:ABC-2 type transport system permease protein
MLLVAPIVQLLVMGFATNTDVTNISLAMRDNDHSYHSREYARSIGASGYFKLQVIQTPEAGDGDLLASKKAGLVVIIPPGFARNLNNNQPAAVQVIVDGADSNFAVQGLNYLQKATRLYTEKLVQFNLGAPLGSSAPQLPGIKVDTRCWFNPALTSRFYMVPAIMALLLLVTTMMVTSMALVKEREDGTLEQVIVTPLRRYEIIIGKLLPFVAVGFAEVTFAIPIILFVFGVPMKGNFVLLYCMAGLFLLTTLGLGAFISTLVKTQQQAMMVSTFFVMMPFVLLSGFAFPVENMPTLFQYIAHAIPLKYFLEILRDIFLKGSGIADLWQQALILLLWGLGILWLAVIKFHKRLD